MLYLSNWLAMIDSDFDLTDKPYSDLHVSPSGFIGFFSYGSPAHLEGFLASKRPNAVLQFVPL
jgi:hypothetical protein